MKLTTKTRYATRALVDLARQPEGNPVPLKKIAHRQSVTPRYLGKIFLRLQRAKLVASKKGPGGGYTLKRDPATISLSEIMQAVGESCAPVFCVAGKRQKKCSRRRHCPTYPHWNQLKNILNRFFNGVTLHDIARARKYRDFNVKR